MAAQTFSPASLARSEGSDGAARKARVLLLDDEPQVLESLRDALRRRFDVVVKTNGFQALKVLTEQPCEVVLSDMRMPLLNGARFLTLAREHAPDTVRLMLTGQSSLDDAVAAVNEGEVFRFLIKPCPVATLIDALDASVARHRALRAERRFAGHTAEQSVRALTEMATAVDPTGPSRFERIRRQALELATAAGGGFEPGVLGTACELLQLGAVALSSEARSQLGRGSRLGRDHAAELERLPELAERYVALLPHLEPVAALLTAAAQPLVMPRPGVAGTPSGARVLRIVLDFELLEAQGVPVQTALGALRARAGRYDQQLLETFAALQGAT